MFLRFIFYCLVRGHLSIHAIHGSFPVFASYSSLSPSLFLARIPHQTIFCPLRSVCFFRLFFLLFHLSPLLRLVSYPDLAFLHSPCVAPSMEQGAVSCICSLSMLAFLYRSFFPFHFHILSIGLIPELSSAELDACLCAVVSAAAMFATYASPPLGIGRVRTKGTALLVNAPL